jgi:hypothetical protein
MSTTANASRFVAANDLEIYVEQLGQGPDALLIGGAGETVESWHFQLDGLADRYRMTAFDNRGRGSDRHASDAPRSSANDAVGSPRPPFVARTGVSSKVTQTVAPDESEQRLERQPSSSHSRNAAATCRRPCRTSCAPSVGSPRDQ